jgi:hypothetical protein
MSSRPPGGFDEYGAAWDSDNDDMLQVSREVSCDMLCVAPIQMLTFSTGLACRVYTVVPMELRRSSPSISSPVVLCHRSF